MAKKVEVKLQLPAGKATPAPGRAGPGAAGCQHHGVQDGAKTADQAGLIIPVVITVYADRSFTFIMKTPPASVLIKKAVNVRRAPRSPTRTRWRRSTATRFGRSPSSRWWTSTPTTWRPRYGMVEGTARSMGVEVVG